MEFTQEQVEQIARERERHLKRSCIFCDKPYGEKETYIAKELSYFHEDCLVRGKEALEIIQGVFSGNRN